MSRTLCMGGFLLARGALLRAKASILVDCPASGAAMLDASVTRSGSIHGGAESVATRAGLALGPVRAAGPGGLLRPGRVRRPGVPAAGRPGAQLLRPACSRPGRGGGGRGRAEPRRRAAEP